MAFDQSRSSASNEVARSEQSSGPDCPSSTDSRSKTILIADDSDNLRIVVRSILETQTEFEVCGEAVDGVDAIEKAKKLRPDLIILDVAMPRMNGLEAASILRRVMPNVYIVLFSMYGDVLGPSPNSTLGFDAVISKPDGIGKLVPCIQTLLGAENMESERAAGPWFELDFGGICRAHGCSNNAAFRAEWINVTKLVCENHKNLVERKRWSEVAHLFGKTPFSN